jgi:hypothetical protein
MKTNTFLRCATPPKCRTIATFRARGLTQCKTVALFDVFSVWGVPKCRIGERLRESRRCHGGSVAVVCVWGVARCRIVTIFRAWGAPKCRIVANFSARGMTQCRIAVLLIIWGVPKCRIGERLRESRRCHGGSVVVV